MLMKNPLTQPKFLPKLLSADGLSEALSLFEPMVDAVKRRNEMPQNAVTLRADLDQESEQKLRSLLQSIAENVANNEVLSFDQLKDTLHFARLLILEGAEHPKEYASSLFLLANVDGSAENFLSDLAIKSGAGLDAVFENCTGYPEPELRNYATRVQFLKSKMIPAQAFYVNTLGRSAEQVHQEDDLRVALQAFIKTLNVDSFASANAIREAVIQFVRDNPKLAWAMIPAVKPSFLWQAKEKARFALLTWVGLVVLFWFWPLLLGWVVMLQLKENKDVPDTHRPTLPHLTQLRSREDYFVHNQFSAAGSLKPGLMRKWTVKVVLGAAQVTLRHIFNKGDLAGVPLLGLEGVDTIHFARWILIDDDTRMLFASNYDGSLESYMVDFIDKVAWGLNLVFSNGQGYPFTRWLVGEGARNEEKFKDFIGNHQIETQVWYASYGHLSAVNIANNAEIRAGLLGAMSDAEAERWLARI